MIEQNQLRTYVVRPPLELCCINSGEIRGLLPLIWCSNCVWQIFKEGKLSHFVDGRGNAGNWMAYVNCARYAAEQNLVAIQVRLRGSWGGGGRGGGARASAAAWGRGRFKRHNRDSLGRFCGMFWCHCYSLWQYYC